MNRVDRLLEMLVILQSKKVVTVEYLKKKFHISTRTVYGDIHMLKELRITVAYENDKGRFVLKGCCPPLSKTQVSQRIILIPDILKNEVMGLLSAENDDRGEMK